MNIDFRTKIQGIFTIVGNSYFTGFFEGKIYTGKLKNICFPGLNCYSCPGALASCPIGSFQNVLASIKNKISLYLIGVFLLFGSVFGRLICGYMCPFGFFQELLHNIKIFKKKKTMPFHSILKYFKYIVLLFFVIVMPIFLTNGYGLGLPYFCKYICPCGTLTAGIPLSLANESIASLLGFLFIWKIFFLILTIILSVKYARPFCKYICPLGLIYGFFNPIALYHFNFDADKCISCNKCHKVCPMDIKTFDTPNSIECVRCGKCLSVCPSAALCSSLKNPSYNNMEKSNKKLI